MVEAAEAVLQFLIQGYTSRAFHQYHKLGTTRSQMQPLAQTTENTRMGLLTLVHLATQRLQDLKQQYRYLAVFTHFPFGFIPKEPALIMAQSSDKSQEEHQPTQKIIQ